MAKTEQIWMDEWKCFDCGKIWRQENRCLSSNELCVYCQSTNTEIQSIVLKQAPVMDKQ